MRERADVGSYDDVLAAATRTTSLTDLGGDEHREGFEILLEDLNSPAAGLTGVGNYFQRSQVKSALVARLLTQLRFAEHPQHVDVPVERPIFVLGLPRTGTTALHRLLAWLSPAYPVGGFSYSHGLEAAVEEGSVRDRAGRSIGHMGRTTAGEWSEGESSG